MGGRSKIEWTDATWNPVTGCTKVSPGCAHCYAEPIVKRLRAGKARSSEALCQPIDFEHVVCHPDRLAYPLRWRTPRRIFVNSLSDLFHETLPDQFIDQVFATMVLARHHQFHVLTKRASRLRRYVVEQPSGGRQQSVVRAVLDFLPESARASWLANYDGAWPPPNVWLGVSVENQRFADERIPCVLQTPAPVRFISAEPLLGPIDLRRYLWPFPALDWVIVGGESGRQARPCEVAWIRSILLQCRTYQVPCFVKQLGARIVGYERHLSDPKGGDPQEWPDDLRVQAYPKLTY